MVIGSRGKSKEMQKRGNLKFKDREKCLYINKYLEFLNNKYTVKYIYHGLI